MRKYKIAFFGLKKEDEEFYKKVLSDNELSFTNEDLSLPNATKYSDFDIVSVFISSKLDAKVLTILKNLKFIATRSTGFDHIDLEFCRKKGIKVANIPSYGENTVAEHAMALLLTITRRIFESVERVKQSNFSPQGLTGVDLKGKIVGVLGTGRIGRHFIKMALGFNTKVIAYDLKPNLEFAKTTGFEYVSFDYLLKKSDIISLHVPYRKETHHLINRVALKNVKKGVIIINTARGGLIETDALFDALQDRSVGGAGLDVLEEEAFLQEEIELLYKDNSGESDFKIALENHMMALLPNVVITPHNAFNSVEALQRIADATVENINGFIEKNSKNLVN